MINGSGAVGGITISGGIEILWEIPPQCHIVHHKFYMI
jgi:hypothetical protein